MSVLRHTIALVTLATLALVAAGCSSTPDSTAPPDGAAATESGFPRTIEHALGEATIPEKPERVVTLSWMNHDIVAALGVVPVGVPETWGGDEEGFTPWFRDQVENELDAEMPEVINVTEDGPDYEQILALQPDVIIGVYSGFTETEYERLSEIAPTVAYMDRPFTAGTWQEHTEIIGEILGEDDKATELIEQTEAAIDEEAAKYPNLDDASFLYSTTFSEGSTEITAYISEDPRVRLLHEFGMVDTPQLAAETADVPADTFFGGISLEELDSVEADVVLAWSYAAADTAYTLEHPVFTRWDPITNGRYFIAEDNTLGMATSGPDVLSIPWAIEQGYIEDISAAIDGDAVVHTAE
ncbi:iron-siderophore ABC transporter substrate-binding protein [Auritidibacter ignavus]|uniref:iron-siderophore ABC transporter substrate-binding protein n=1 Tax=Auritidibacter ignavus TaxID=678932 RepID=UPI000F02A878|nr:iron-siderophore ABC transporter substrate-binding protein [Auritidibacter ignavus]NIH70813.1 iron complex transport system substrate-binding protein [Auritidibacter ignavus]RMX22361.1 iron-siderophore ABC transporter substrate-binding protein [Auritidibacter ignavus]WGH81970.1 iron-siderophore ABC transporter substrate-binding protein [Auritidibacter ignavus]WGH86579.1 iron-siderophore ABC transporter substrate-binding protein [Auritidibacter ignavus]WGH88865.1 iron-siderophore ABC transpo